MLLIFAVVLPALLGGCGSEPVAKGQRPLIRINDQAISKAAFLARFEQVLQKDQPLSGVERAELQRSFLVQLIDRELIRGEARRLKVTVTDADVEQALAEYRKDYPGTSFEEMLRQRGQTLQVWRGELRDNLIMEALLDQVVYANITVSDREIADYYKARRAEFDRPAQVRARQIVVADEAEGLKVLGLLRQGQAFAEVATRYSLSPDASDGGDLGFFGRGEMPQEFDEVVFDLPVGKLSDLVKSEYGYHIFLVEERRKATRLTRKQAEGEIRDLLEASKREEAYLNWLQELRARAEIAVDWTQLEETNNQNR
jgi:peptidyl-prolyl cis-trans isomerase C